MDDGTRISPEVEKFLRLARAKEVTACHELLKANPSLLNSVEAGGFAALHFAAFNGDVAMMEMLFALKPDLNIENYDGNTPLTMAAKGRQPNSIRMLVEAGADLHHKTKSGATSLHYAASMEDPSIVELLISLGAKLETTPTDCGTVLHWAAHTNDSAVAGTLIYKYNFPVDAVDSHGGSPLFIACHGKNSEMVLFLLTAGANPNLAAKDGSTPLHTSVQFGTVADVKNLLAFGANPNAVDSDKKTPLQLAQEKNMTESAKELSKPPMDAEKKAADAARFKAQGNKVFAEGESHKAAKFYSLAISLDPKNHVYFSNRSACNFNTKNYRAAFFDACRCLQLDPSFVRGYFRKAATLNAMGEKKDAAEVVAQGLKLDPKNADLLTLKEELQKK